jgi:hypothetical protein
MAEAIDPNADYAAGNRTVKGYAVIACICALKEAFVGIQRRYRPDIRRAGGDDLKWRNTAFLLLANECNPFAYMSFAFDACSHLGTVYPNMVTTGHMVQKYVMERPDIESDLKLLIKLQADSISHLLKRGRSLEEVLLDTTLELSAVFRFALAWSENRHDIAARFREAAQRMLTFQPLYKQLLAKWLPEELR